MHDNCPWTYIRLSPSQAPSEVNYWCMKRVGASFALLLPIHTPSSISLICHPYCANAMILSTPPPSTLPVPLLVLVYIFPLFSFSILTLPFLPVSPLYCQCCPPPLRAPLGPGDFAFVCDSGVSGARGGGWGMRALSQAVRWKSFLNCLLSSFVPAVVPGNGLPGLHYNSLSRGTPSPKPWLCFITFFWLQCNLQSYSNTHTHRL